MADPAPVSKSAVCKAGIVLRRIARGTGPSRRRRWPGGRARHDGAQEQRSHGPRRPRGTRGSGRAGAVVGVFAVVAVRPVTALPGRPAPNRHRSTTRPTQTPQNNLPGGSP